MQRVMETNTRNYHRYSYVKTQEYTYKWTLYDVSQYDNNTEIRSGYFYPRGREEDEWWLSLQIANKITLNFLRNGGSKKGKCKLEVHVTDGNNKVFLHGFYDFKLSSCNQVESNTIFSGLDNVINDVKEMGKDTFNIGLHFKFHRVVDKNVEFLLSAESLNRDFLKTFKQDLSEMFEDQVNTDIVFKVSNETIGAHKIILSAGSPVFAKMFRQEMSETQTCVVDVQDVTPCTLKQLLAFMYGKFIGYCDYDFQMCLDLYYAADKYQIPTLKNNCSARLISLMDKENVIQILKLADLHSDTVLRNRILRFIVCNAESCIKEKWWDDLVRERGPLVKELEQLIVHSKFNEAYTKNMPSLSTHQFSFLKIQQINYKWTLHNVNEYEDSAEMRSQQICCDGNNFQLKLTIGTKIELIIIRRNREKEALKSKCEVQVTDGSNKLWLEGCKEIQFRKDYGYDKINVISGLTNLLIDLKKSGKDTINIKLHMIYKVTKSRDIDDPTTSPTQFQDFSNIIPDDLTKMFDGRVNTDVVLKVSNKTIGAHKSILSARSPVFAKMFQQDMSGTQTCVIEVQDVTPVALRELVAFIYGKFRLDYGFQTCMDMYYAADKYQVQQVRDILGTLLASKSDEENVIQILRLAHLHNDSKLKYKAMSFIAYNSKACVEKEWWDEFMTERCPLAKELEQFLIKSTDED